MTAAFIPGPDTARRYRSALGRYATGVTIVTTTSDWGPVGITANSFASVSLDPPLVLWSPARASQRFRAFEQAKSFAIHVLGSDQAAICGAFARDGAAFDACDWGLDADGLPEIRDCLLRLRCQTHAIHDGGDHAIIVGLVTEAAARPDGEPLLFHDGAFGAFQRSAT